MTRIRDTPTREIEYGIDRCKARLSGIMPLGIMTRELVNSALRQYRNELKRRINKTKSCGQTK
jgi:hypothetical protein